MVSEHTKKDGCWNCVHEWFGECAYYGYNTGGDATELKGISICDYENWSEL